MRRNRLAFLGGAATVAVLGIVACGGDDNVTPAGDAGTGTDGSLQDAPAQDSSIQDSGVDTSTTDASDGGRGRLLDGGFCDGAPVTVTSVTPPFGWTGGKTAVTISGAGFVSTPTVFLQSDLDGSVTLLELSHAAFVSDTSITAIIPSGLAVGTYDVVVVDPDGCAGSLAGKFKITANPPPDVTNVSPATGTTQTDVPVTITGCDFQANATLSLVDSSGTVTAQSVTTPAACTGAATCADGSDVCTMSGVIGTHSGSVSAGDYLVRVSNPTDATYGDYSSFVITTPDGKLVGNWAASSNALNTGRRSLAVTTGSLDNANRFLYAIAGEDSGGAALGTYEVASVDAFGRVGKWTTGRYALASARSGLTAVVQGRYVYAIGGTGSTGGTGGAAPSGTPISTGTIEMAKILDPANAPILADPPAASTSAGTLGAGTWYYKVSAILDGTAPDNPNNESLPSDEVQATLSAAGEVTLTWTVPASISGHVTTFDIYRTAAANGVSQNEVLIKSGLPNSAGTFLDDGSSTPGTQTPLVIGETSAWTVPALAALAHPRFNTAAAIAPDPTGSLYVFVAGGFGKCSIAAVSNAIMNCTESALISADGSTLGAFTADLTHALAHPRMRHGLAAMTAANGPSGFGGDAGANGAFLVVGGGYSISGQGSTVEDTQVGTGGTIGSWSNPTGFGTQRDGTQVQVANGYAYAFFGGMLPNYSQTSDLSPGAVITNGNTLTFGAWSNSGAGPLGASVGRLGVTLQSAFFYAIGGTTNDTDALKTVYSIVY